MERFFISLYMFLLLVAFYRAFPTDTWFNPHTQAKHENVRSCLMWRIRALFRRIGLFFAFIAGTCYQINKRDNRVVHPLCWLLIMVDANGNDVIVETRRVFRIRSALQRKWPKVHARYRCETIGHWKWNREFRWQTRAACAHRRVRRLLHVDNGPEITFHSDGGRWRAVIHFLFALDVGRRHCLTLAWCWTGHLGRKQRSVYHEKYDRKLCFLSNTRTLYQIVNIQIFGYTPSHWHIYAFLLSLSRMLARDSRSPRSHCHIKLFNTFLVRSSTFQLFLVSKKQYSTYLCALYHRTTIDRNFGLHMNDRNRTSATTPYLLSQSVRARTEWN